MQIDSYGECLEQDLINETENNRWNALILPQEHERLFLDKGPQSHTVLYR